MRLLYETDNFLAQLGRGARRPLQGSLSRTTVFGVKSFGFGGFWSPKNPKPTDWMPKTDDLNEFRKGTSFCQVDLVGEEPLSSRFSRGRAAIEKVS